jgi:hypothetical protein
MFSYPVAFFHRQCFWRGELPLWNPLSHCGVPFLAQWNTLTLYPLSLIYLLLPLTWSLSFFCLAHLFWGGLGMYFLAQRWTHHRLAAGLAGVIFSFNGLTLNFLMWPSHIATFSWLPWVVWLGQRAWREGGTALVWATVAGAMQMLAGGPETIAATWLILLALAGGDWVREAGRRGRLSTPEPHAWVGGGQGTDVSPLTPSLSPSEGERVPARAGEGSSARSLSFRAPGNPSLPLTTRDFPADLLPPLDDALKQAETWLARNQPTDFRENLLELYFRLHSFRRTAELYDERFVTITEPGRSVRVRLFCLDPSFLLRQALARGKAAVFFSATLTPIDYYRALLGGSPEDPLLQLPSPFPPEHLAVLVQDRIHTHFKARAGSLPEVVQAIASLVEGRPGNYMVYLPSYQYLTAVQEQFHAQHSAVPILVQRPGMSEPDREAFLAAFAVEHGETLVGFAVMGGIFGEGIDLVGDRLIGAIIVGVGLPQLCVERDLIRDYFQEQTGAGFDFAYTFPGMNRVLQAIGRVIRSETDRGVVLLIDARFAEPRYRRLFPAWWQSTCARDTADIRNALAKFWEPSAQA